MTGVITPYSRTPSAVGLNLLLLSILCLTVTPASRGATLVAREYDLKAAYLVNFTKFVAWPPAGFNQPSAPLVIGLLGEDPFGEILDRTVRSQVVNNHPLVIKRFKRGEDPGGCHLLFISRSEKEGLPEIVRGLQGRGVLLVSEMDQFLDQGGMINLYLEADLVKFAANPEAAERAGLKISSKLLGLAKVVKAGPAKR